jgi:hypothetical protein
MYSHEALHRKRTREHMHLHGMLDSAAAPPPPAGLFTDSTLRHWASGLASALKKFWQTSNPQPQHDTSPPGGVAGPRESHSTAEARRTNRLTYKKYLSTFIPVAAGGQCTCSNTPHTHTLIPPPYSQSGDLEQFFVQKDEVDGRYKANIDAPHDPKTLGQLIKPFNSDKVFRLLPNGSIFTGK